MIKINNLTKSIEGKIILDHVNMHVKKGSIYGLVGPNGSGKSTIIRSIMGIYRIDSGEILLGGERIYENAPVKAKIAYIPDDIFYHMTDTIDSLMRFYKGLYPGFDEKKYESLLPLFEMLDKKKMIRSYSKGMQRQAAILLSLCINPEVMILDEPLDGLDPVVRRQVLSLIVKDVAERETSVLISSHNLRELEDICDYVGIMEKGRLVIERSLDDLQDSIVKIQIAFNGSMPKLPDNVEILHKITVGKVHTLIVKGEPGTIEDAFGSLNPILMDVLPLTLEEIFIYEMGGAGDVFKDALS